MTETLHVYEVPHTCVGYRVSAGLGGMPVVEAVSAAEIILGKHLITDLRGCGEPWFPRSPRHVLWELPKLPLSKATKQDWVIF